MKHFWEVNLNPERSFLITLQAFVVPQKVLCFAVKFAKFGFWKINFYQKPKSNHSQIFFKIGALKNFEIFTGKYMYWSHFDKDAGRMDRNFIKKTIQHGCFPKNNAKFLKQHFLQNTFGGCFWKTTFFQKQQIPQIICKKPILAFSKKYIMN